jgi:uncharacterized protein (DUF1697 family)
MPRYVAFLRAINVGGHTVKMDRLRELFEELGLRSVETFIASGNVLFSSPSKAGGALETRIERHLAKALGYDVATFVRDTGALEGVLGNHPYGDPLPDGHTLHVGLLKTSLGAAERKKLIGLRTAVDEFHVHEREAYWLCRGRFSDSLLPGGAVEKAVAMPATFRNVNTIRRLASKVAVVR